MKSFLVTCLVEFSEEEHNYWSEGTDETFSIARKVHAQENGVHIVAYSEIKNKTLPKYLVLTKEGGV